MKKRIAFTGLLLGVFLVAGFYFTSSYKSPAAITIPLESIAPRVTLPPAPVSSFTAYREKREATRAEDIKILQALLDSGVTEQPLLHDIALQLSQITEAREAELAIEGVLTAGGFSPCLVVAAPGSITVILGRESLTRGEAALIMTLCENHTDEPLENIKIMTGDMI